MEIADKSCRQFVQALALKVPVPGGGAAAAFVGSIGIALSNMVGNYTIGKKKYANVEDKVQELLKKGAEVQDALLDLIAKDAEAFEPLSQAYGLPSETDEQKKMKEEVLERESKNACFIPIKIIRKAVEGIKIHKCMCESGNKLLISDVGCGVVFLQAALIAGKLNVLINLNNVKDTEFVKKMREEIDSIVEEGIDTANEVYESVLKIIG
jgi:formiminotetrahydrofolate cyclodeaminase